MPVLLSLDKSNFEITRFLRVGCCLTVRHENHSLVTVAKNEYADYDRNQLVALRELVGKLVVFMLERVNEETAHTLRCHINPKLWLIKIEVE